MFDGDHSQLELCMIRYPRNEYVHFHRVCVSIYIYIYQWDPCD